MFTAENTEGFTTAELEILNEALVIRTAKGEDEKNASDAINNAFYPGVTIAELVEAPSK